MFRKLTGRIVKVERGFTTVVVMGMLMVGMLLVAAAFAASDNDTVVARHDQYYKEAYNAAEAGVNWYFYHLTQDANFWSKCTSSGLPLNMAGTSWASEIHNTIPGSEAQYAVELLPVAGKTCTTGDGSTVIGSDGSFSIRSTGNYRGVRRTIIATFKRTSFLNFIWFTDYETNDPNVPRSNLSTSQVQTLCTQHDWPSPRDSRCEDPYFISADSLKGPVRSNDMLNTCGSPTFGRSGKNDKLQTAAPSFYTTCSSGGTPVLNSTPQTSQSNLVMPPNNSTLKTHADCTYTGPTHIVLNSATSASVTNGGTTTSCTLNNGVIYVQNATCNTDYPTSEGYPANDGCGDAWVHSSGSGAGHDVTIAADNDVIVDGSIIRSNANVAVGLIANNFVRMYHPCSSGSNKSTSPEDPGIGAVSNPEIDAAILSLQHSWIVDNWDCGSPLGSLKIVGAIAQKYRGTVGTFSGSGTIASGYSKNYNYDDALAYHDPPFFLDPVQAGWDISSETEQVPTH